MNPTPPKPPADALPDVKALCERLDRLSDVCNLSTREAIRDAIAALERLAGECELLRASNELLERWLKQDNLRRSPTEAGKRYAKMEAQLVAATTSLRSSEAALAQGRQASLDAMTELDQLRAELTALRANAQEDSVLLDWLDDRVVLVSEAMGNGPVKMFEHTPIGWAWNDEVSIRQAIRAAMSAAPAPAQSGGKGE